MKVKCPYCDCHYDIRLDFLGTPLGNQQLGFGWWLRCYKCHRKFWLSSTKSIIKEPPPRVAQKIKKLEKFKRKKRKSGKLIISLALISGSLYIAFYQRNFIQTYFTNKISKLIQDTTASLELQNIAYRIDENNQLYITGFIVNNTASIMGINSLKVNVYENDNKEFSWEIIPKIKNIIPGDKIFFSDEHVLNKAFTNIKITVAVN